MSKMSYTTVDAVYAEAMRYSGPEASARLYIADRLAEATYEATLTEAMQGTPRVRPVILSLGGLLVRLGERLEAAGNACRCPEYRVITE